MTSQPQRENPEVISRLIFLPRLSMTLHRMQPSGVPIAAALARFFEEFHYVAIFVPQVVCEDPHSPIQDA